MTLWHSPPVKPVYEVQLQPCEGGWQFVVTTTVGKDTWTAGPVRLKSADAEEARKEAWEQVRALMRVGGGASPGCG
jgi:hypothetical protein